MGNVTPENLNVSRNNLSLQLIIKKTYCLNKSH